jgi:hypothetical protein
MECKVYKMPTMYETYGKQVLRMMLDHGGQCWADEIIRLLPERTDRYKVLREVRKLLRVDGYALAMSQVNGSIWDRQTHWYIRPDYSSPEYKGALKLGTEFVEVKP